MTALPAVTHDNVVLDIDGITLYHGDFLRLDRIKSQSIDLIVTSPPYNIDIEYGSSNDNLSYGEYLDFSADWLRKCYDLCRSDGRMCLNIPLDKNKGGQQSVCADFTTIAKSVGWRYHSSIIWNEGNVSRRTAWGSWLSASAPYVIAPVETIVVLYKESWKKTNGARTSDIERQEFIDWTNGLWTFNGQSKKGAGGHPTAFPLELPKRCIKLFSFVGDTVFDPFVGSGSSLIAASILGRRGIGVEIDSDYCQIALTRLEKEASVYDGRIL
ncbi:MAG: site-specific DNA-methyltransferase [Gammaproteobacteria bacterium]|nr:site-specific DNA-methyltransferase [Gammaproteobacteria bacterium]